MGTRSGEVRLAELIAALSLATDLGMGQPLEKALRVCLLALELGHRVGCEDAALSDVYYLALLQHVGCTAIAPEIAIFNGGNDVAFHRGFVHMAHASDREFLVHFARHVGEDRSLAKRARLVAAGVAGGSKRFDLMVAVQCEAAAGLADRLGMSDGVRLGLAHANERWDGKGGPDGVGGEDVSLAQRVVIVCARRAGSVAPGGPRRCARRDRPSPGRSV